MKPVIAADDLTLRLLGQPARVPLALCGDEAVIGVLLRAGFTAERAIRRTAERMATDPEAYDTVRRLLRRDGRAAGWLRAAGVDEAWVRELGGS